MTISCSQLHEYLVYTFEKNTRVKEVFGQVHVHAGYVHGLPLHASVIFLYIFG